MITDSRRVCENNLKREKVKAEDVKYVGQELGQVLDVQFNLDEGSSLTWRRHPGCIWEAVWFLVMG